MHSGAQGNDTMYNENNKHSSAGGL